MLPLVWRQRSPRSRIAVNDGQELASLSWRHSLNEAIKRVNQATAADADMAFVARPIRPGGLPVTKPQFRKYRQTEDAPVDRDRHQRPRLFSPLIWEPISPRRLRHYLACPDQPLFPRGLPAWWRPEQTRPVRGIAWHYVGTSLHPSDSQTPRPYLPSFP